MTEETKNLCAQIPTDLHAKVREEQEQRGMTLGQFVEYILKEYFEGGQKMDGVKTIAFQVPAELFQRLKDYLAENKLSQKQFFVDLIEKALAEET